MHGNSNIKPIKIFTIFYLSFNTFFSKYVQGLYITPLMTSLAVFVQNTSA